MASSYMATPAFTAGFLPASSGSKTAALAVPLILSERDNSQSAKGSCSLMLRRASVHIPSPATNGTCGDDDTPSGAGNYHVHFVLPNNVQAVGRRMCLATAGAILATALNLSGGTPVARGAVLEADDDVELLEKVKEDRKRRLERQGVISSSGRETGYLQDLVYKMSKVGRAIDNNDLSEAGTILGPDAGAEWVKKVNAAFIKLSSTPEDKKEIDTFNSSLVSLIGSVANKDAESSKLAFVTSAGALERWAAMTGLAGKLSGL